MTLTQLDDLGGALKDLDSALAHFEHACTPDEHGQIVEAEVTRAAAALRNCHLAWNTAFEVAQPILPAPVRPRGWLNMTRVNGCA